MWRIFKAELNYYKYYLIIPCTMAIFVVVVNNINGWTNLSYDLQGTRTVIASMTAIIFFVRFIIMLKEKKDRLYIKLPISLSKIGYSRVAFVLIFWFSFLIIFWLGSLNFKPYLTALIIWETTFYTAFILVVNSIPFILRDAIFWLKNKYRKIIIFILYLILTIIGTIIFFTLGVNQKSYTIMQSLLPLKDNLNAISMTVNGAIGGLIIGIGFTLLSVFIYCKRSTYSE